MGQTTGELKAELERHRVEVGADLEAIGDRVSPGRMVERRRAQLSERVSGFKDRVMGSATEARSTVHEDARAVAGAVADAPSAARRQVQGNPIAAGVIAFAAGVLVASALPESEPEQQLAEQMQPGLAQAAQESRTVAGEMAEHLEPAAKEATKEVAHHAQEAAEQVKEHAASGGAD